MTEKNQEPAIDAATGYRILGTSLVHVGIEQELIDPVKEQTAGFEYGASHDLPDLSEDNVATFSARCVMMKKYADDDRPVVVVACEYFSVVEFQSRPTAEQMRKAATNLTGTTVWSQFRILALVLAQQIGVQFPYLPSMPSDIEVDKREDDLGEQHS